MVTTLNTVIKLSPKGGFAHPNPEMANGKGGTPLSRTDSNLNLNCSNTAKFQAREMFC